MNTQQEFWDKAWTLLRRGTVDKRHGFNTGTLSTLYHGGAVAGAAIPKSRTVVLREVDARLGTMTCFTDRRSRKVAQLRGVPYASWCFWDLRSKLQITGYGTVTMDTGEAARRRLLALPKHSRRAYATLSAPGSSLGAAQSGLPADWDSLELEQTDYAADNFTILTTTLLEMDILELGRSHRRLNAARPTGSDDWALNWVVP